MLSGVAWYRCQASLEYPLLGLAPARPVPVILTLGRAHYLLSLAVHTLLATSVTGHPREYRIPWAVADMYGYVWPPMVS